MTGILLLLGVALVVCVVVFSRVLRQRVQREEYERMLAAPLDPVLDEVFVRPANATWRQRGAAENAVRAAAPHIDRVTRETSARPLLIVHSDEFVHPGVLIVTTAHTLHFAQGRLRSVPHRPATTTTIMSTSGGVRSWVEVHGQQGRIEFGCGSVEQARLICGAVDCWTADSSPRPDPRVVITPKRVVVPDEFFVDTLRAAGFPVTACNMRSIHERFGMMFINKARAFIDGKHGVAVGERFTEEHGRPGNDDLLPGWPVDVLRGWIELEPEIAPIMAVLPHSIRDFLLQTAGTGGYLAHPERPLSMWKSDWYTENGSGARRPLGPDQPPVPA